MTCSPTSFDFIELLVVLVLAVYGAFWCVRWLRTKLHRDNIVMRPYYDDYPDSEFRI